MNAQLRRLRRCFPIGWRTIWPNSPIIMTAAAMRAKRSNTWGAQAACAAQQTAHSEAVGYFKRALELLKNLPDSADRGRQEFDLQMAFKLVALGGQSRTDTPEREPVLIRARELCEQLGEDAKQMEALLQLAFFRFFRREYGVARELAQRVLGLAEPAKATAMVAGAHYVLGTIAYSLGELEAAREHLELAVALFGPGPFRNFGELNTHWSQPPYLLQRCCFSAIPRLRSEKAANFWTRCGGSLTLFPLRPPWYGRLLIHVLSSGQPDSPGASRRTPFDRHRARDALRHVAIATFYRGWALGRWGRGQEGLAEMSRALPALEGNVATTGFYAHLADSYRKNGRPEEGLTTVATALRETERGGEGIARARTLQGQRRATADA